jgi:glycosyltransferase involved in cell wall biosynthesis
MISVIMPVYNCEKYVAEAVQSILNQTYNDFEFIIVDDGSNDRTYEIVQSFKDSRIKLLKNEVNQGLVYTLNKALSEAQYPYIARMDGDDISLEQRLEKQLHILESNDQILVCGCSYRTIGAENKNYIFQPESILTVIDVPITHPTSMIRKSFIKSNNIQYNPEAQNGVEDLRFWFEIFKAAQFKQDIFYNTEEILFEYRVHPNQISSNSNIKHKISGSKVRRRNLIEFFYENNYKFSFEKEDVITSNDINNFLIGFNKLDSILKKKIFKEKVIFYMFLSLETTKEKLMILPKILALKNHNLLLKVVLSILGRNYIKRF